jgi:proline iminopeptidase
MTYLYPEIEPYKSGLLAVGDGNGVYWEICGNAQGKPAVVLHGGPGSGCTMWQRRLFDSDVYCLVLFDQRNCGRSTPHASVLETNLAENNTTNLIKDIESLREHLNIDRWLVFGGSWGSTLALAYAESHPERVTEMILFGITTGRHSEIDWLFRGGLARFFPIQWERLRSALPMSERNGDIVEAYSRRLNDPSLSIRQQAANDWCLWESATIAWPPIATLAERFTNPGFALGFARIVTHYMSHNLWLEDGILLRNIHVLDDIQAILVNGRFDFQAPIGNAWELNNVLPHSELIIVDNAGHAADDQELIRATNLFAR